MTWLLQTGDLARVYSDEVFSGSQLAAVRRTMAVARNLPAGQTADLYRLTPSGERAALATLVADCTGVVRRAA